MKSKKLILGSSLMAGVLGAILSKNKAGKIIGLGVAGVSAGILLKDLYRRERQVVEAECQETEKEIEESGVDIKKIKDISLLNNDDINDENEEVIFGETLLNRAYSDCIFDDSMLKYDPKDVLHTLHVLQNVEKNRLVISIPLPRKTNKNGLGPADVRQHFENIFEEFIGEKHLDMQMFTNQIGIHVGKSTEDGYIYYTEIERERDENFNQYLKRINTIMNSWDKGDKEAKEKWGIVDGDLETIRFEQQLILEFPVFPKSSNKKGLDLLSAMALLQRLTGVESINVSTTGREQKFEFNHIIFHPGDDYGTILQVNESKKIVTVDL